MWSYTFQSAALEMMIQDTTAVQSQITSDKKHKTTTKTNKTKNTPPH